MQFINSNSSFVKLSFTLLAGISLLPVVTPSIALFGGLIFALTIGNPFPTQTRKISKHSLQIAVVGLGFGMNLHESLKTGLDGIGFTLFSVASIMIIGFFVGRWIKLSKATSYLISAGTAICGGSAIAAISPVIRANQIETSVSLATVFTLNAIGLILFPYLGHYFHLSQQQFGMWAAIAIHDTSSVVGAGATYGSQALKIATMVKLTRALWIIPLAFVSSYIFRNKESRISIPWFILFFVGAMVLSSYTTIFQHITGNVVSLSKQLLTFTLFLIGSGLTRNSLLISGFRPFVLAVILWVFIGSLSLFSIIYLT
ncbi:MAG: putative sulfate exporter family transporter [Bacteroidales bacterium]|nr:putative sulfate exporter family transporter [Bacteroidales bacterium]